MKKLFICWLLISSFNHYLMAQNKWQADTTLLSIYQLEYHRKAHELALWLQSPYASYREAAALGFSSIKDSSFTPLLLVQLQKESNSKVQVALIQSIGLCGGINASAELLAYYQKNKQWPQAHRCLEAMGWAASSNLTETYVALIRASGLKTKDWYSSWYHGVYQAYRKKQLNPQNEDLQPLLDSVYFHNLAHDEAVQYLYLRMYPQPKVSSNDQMRRNLSTDSIQQYFAFQPDVYRQLDWLNKQVILTANQCFEFTKPQYRTLIRYEALERLFNSHSKMVGFRWNGLLDTLVAEGDPALLSLIAQQVLEQLKANVKPVVDSAILVSAQQQLSIPREFETWNDLQKTIAYWRKQPYRYQSVFDLGFQDEPDWQHIKQIPETQLLLIKTNKGDFTMKLYINESPVSVSRFLKEVEAKYYNGKRFHRVVPHFVVQNGCLRGDGWGAADWATRSETSAPIKYKKGSVGLASAGRDTESLQFFITHNATPNLNHEYTLIGEIVKGQHLLRNIEIGDYILSISKVN